MKLFMADVEGSEHEQWITDLMSKFGDRVTRVDSGTPADLCIIKGYLRAPDITVWSTYSIYWVDIKDKQWESLEDLIHYIEGLLEEQDETLHNRHPGY
jgi:hypothetical protein